MIGQVDKVYRLAMNLQSQTYPLKIYKEGEKDKILWIQGGLRHGVLGTWEYAFPKESMDEVLTSLEFHKKRYPHLATWLRRFAFRKALGCEKVPKFNPEKGYLWFTEGVNIIPIGVRYDKELTEYQGEMKGWKHEAI